MDEASNCGGIAADAKATAYEPIADGVRSTKCEPIADDARSAKCKPFTAAASTRSRTPSASAAAGGLHGHSPAAARPLACTLMVQGTSSDVGKAL